MKVAIFRPADERETRSVELLESLGFDVLSDPLLEPRGTGEKPLEGADFTVFTSVTGVEIGASELGDTAVCAIGPRTRDALEEHGVTVDVVPEEYTSGGLVEALRGRVRGRKVEVARSDHGSDELLDGLNDAGAFVHETVLYELVRPEGGGEATVEGLRKGEVDAVLFTSSLTVEHLVGTGDGVVDYLSSAVVGTIGEPTRRTAESLGVEVDFVAEDETFEDLAQGLVSVAEERG